MIDFLLLIFQQESGEVLRDVEYAKNLALDIHLPPGREEKWPVVLYLHGGGWGKGDKKEDRNFRFLPPKGIAVASINYRLSREARYPAAVEDCRAAIRWVREKGSQYKLDPKRIGIFGISAGGHLALLTGLLGEDSSRTTSSRVSAICSWYGPADFTKGHGRDGGFLNFIGGTIDQVPEKYREASPVTHASKDDPPTLMMYGETDEVVPLWHGHRLQKALRAAGAHVELVTVKNGGHGSNGKNMQPSMKEIMEKTIAFFQEHLRGEEKQR